MAERLDRFMSSPDIDMLASHAWVWSARKCPSLARSIVRVGRSLFGGRLSEGTESTSDAIRAFVHRPCWLGLADQLARLTEDPPATGDEVLLAQLALTVASLTGWSRTEEAYWHALIEQAPIGRYLDAEDLDVVIPAERCRVVAKWALDTVRADGATLANVESLSPREAARALDSLSEVVEGGVDVSLLLQEIESARGKEVESLDRATARRLAALARLAGYRQESRWHDSLFTVVTGAEITFGLDRSISLLREWSLGKIGLWIHDPRRRSGWGGWFESISESSSTFHQADREQTEANLLPASFRCSRDLIGREGKPVGRVYSDRPIEGPLVDRWLGRLASAWQAYWERGNNLQSVEVVAIKKVVDKPKDVIDARVRRAIGEFSAGAGHEINNPLGAISGHAARLLKDEVVPERRHALQQIHQQVARIRQMIRDLQLIGGNLSLERSPVDLVSILSDASREAEKRLAGGHLVLRSCPAEWQVQGDRLMLSRMIAELVVNGAQAAGPGGEVTVWAERSSEDQNAIDVVVRDSGPGLTSPQRERAFIPFYSGREAGRGLGMGLPVAERIALEHGGAIVIGHGKPTTVRIHLPSAKMAG
jgi:signal transduction histidine kinase